MLIKGSGERTVKIDKEKGSLLKELVRLSAVGLELVLSIFIGLGIGLLIDKELNTSPWGMMLFFSLER